MAQAAVVTGAGQGGRAREPSTEPPSDAALDGKLWTNAEDGVGAAPGWLFGRRTPDAEVSAGPTKRLLDPADYLAKPVEPPEMGWQRLAFHLSARVRPGKREARQRAWRELIRQPLGSAKVIAVFSPKGGVGKSTTAIGLGNVLSMVRGDLVAALDANPDAGNLVKRVPEPYSLLSARDLNRDASRLRCHSDLLPYLTEGDTGLCVVRSDPYASERPTPVEYRQVLDVLSRFFALIIVDLGTGIREPAFLAILDAADAVVAVTEPVFDCAEVLAEGLEWLRLWHPDKISAGTLVINEIRAEYSQASVARVAADLGEHMLQIHHVPRDPHLAIGGVPHWPLLAKQTQDRYLELGATVIDNLPDKADPLGKHGTAER